MRADREQQIAGLPEDECNTEPEIQRRLLSQQETRSYRSVKIGLGACGRGCFVRVLHVVSHQSFRGRPQGGIRNPERCAESLSGFRDRSLPSRPGMTRWRKETSLAHVSVFRML